VTDARRRMSQSRREELEAEEEVSGCTAADDLLEGTVGEARAAECLRGGAVEEAVAQGVLLLAAVRTSCINVVACG
jgi:hypothetical protein